MAMRTNQLLKLMFADGLHLKKASARDRRATQNGRMLTYGAATAGRSIQSVRTDSSVRRSQVFIVPTGTPTLAKPLARKQQLLERLLEDPAQHERDEIERQLEEIDTALNLLDEAGPGKSSDEQ